jgi:hypothetical protein
MVFLEAVHELTDHLPGFFGVGAEVFFLAFFSEFGLPFSFGFPFFSEEVSSGYFEGLLRVQGSFFHEVFQRFIPFGD